MGLFDGALSSLEGIVSNGASEHSDVLHEAIQNIESNPQQLGNLLGKFTNHPEIAYEVQGWMAKPEAQALLGHVAEKTGNQPNQED